MQLEENILNFGYKITENIQREEIFIVEEMVNVMLQYQNQDDFLQILKKNTSRGRYIRGKLK
jgi:hypothetical protein